MNVQAFAASSPTITIASTSTASTSVALPGKGASVRIVNEGAGIAFVSIGSGTQTATLPTTSATNTCTPVLGGSDVVFSIPSDSIQNISACCRSGASATLTVQVGEGL